MKIIRRIYVIECRSRPMEAFFHRTTAKAALAAAYGSMRDVRVVPYAPLLPARKKKRRPRR